MYSREGGTCKAFLANTVRSAIGMDRSTSTSRTMRSLTKSRSVSFTFFSAIANDVSKVTLEMPTRESSSCESFLPKGDLGPYVFASNAHLDIFEAVST